MANGGSGSFTLITELPGAFLPPQAINNNGTILGCAEIPIGSGGCHGFLWTPTSANLTVDVITLIPPPAGFDYTKPQALNNNGQVVGVMVASGIPTPFLYEGGNVYDLSILNAQLQWGTPVGINDRGEIVINAGSAVYLLTPPPLPVLSVSETHIGSFMQGQHIAAYTLSVQNSGSAATSGAVSVTDALPTTFTAIAMNGPGWACSMANLMCSRTDALAAGGTYPPLIVTVSVASNAASPITNQVSVSGGGVSTTATAGDPTTVLAAFADSGSFLPFVPFIDLLSEYGITSGCGASPPMYCPDNNITEGQMAVFVVRSVMGGDAFAYTQTPYFSDVPANYPFFPWIQKLQDLGIALPCAPAQFCPESAVTRGIMAVLIIRGRYGVSVPSNYPAIPYFTDLGTNHPYFPWIQKMSQLGITSGCGQATYCPDNPVTRGQMAVFIMGGLFNQSLPATTPIVVWASPANASPGQTALVTIIGQSTNFSSSTQVSAGVGIRVSNVSVSNGTTLTAQLTVAGGAGLGPRSITVTTGSEEATLPNGFRVQ